MQPTRKGLITQSGQRRELRPAQSTALKFIQQRLPAPDIRPHTSQRILFKIPSSRWLESISVIAAYAMTHGHNDHFQSDVLGLTLTRSARNEPDFVRRAREVTGTLTVTEPKRGGCLQRPGMCQTRQPRPGTTDPLHRHAALPDRAGLRRIPVSSGTGGAELAAATRRGNPQRIKIKERTPIHL